MIDLTGRDWLNRQRKYFVGEENVFYDHKSWHGDFDMTQWVSIERGKQNQNKKLNQCVQSETKFLIGKSRMWIKKLNSQISTNFNCLIMYNHFITVFIIVFLSIISFSIYL